MHKRLLFLLFPFTLAFAQVTPNSVTVTASRSNTAQPDQVVFYVRVDGPLTTTQSDALSALQGSGITQANFSSVTTVQQYGPPTQQATTQLEWTFTLPVAFTDMKTTAGLLSALQKNNAQKKNGLTISFGVQGTQVSAQAQQSQTCSMSDLMSDARTQAQKIASAAGKGVGDVLAVSGSTSTTTSGTLGSSPLSALGCTLTVKFQLTGF